MKQHVQLQLKRWQKQVEKMNKESMMQLLDRNKEKRRNSSRRRNRWKHDSNKTRLKDLVWRNITKWRQKKRQRKNHHYRLLRMGSRKWRHCTRRLVNLALRRHALKLVPHLEAMYSKIKRTRSLEELTWTTMQCKTVLQRSTVVSRFSLVWDLFRKPMATICLWTMLMLTLLPKQSRSSRKSASEM